MSENPATTLYNLMEQVFDYTAPNFYRDDKHNPDRRLLDNSLVPRSKHRRIAVGFGPNQHGISVPGFDGNGDPVFMFGRYSAYSQNNSLVLCKDNRFRLGWQTRMTRDALAQASFLRYGYSGRDWVWYVTSSDSSAGYVDDFRARVPYINEKMMRPHYGGVTLRSGQRFSDAMNGWYQVVPNEDPDSTMLWTMEPAENQLAPGIEEASEPTAQGPGAQKFDRAVMLKQVSELRALQEKRYRRDEARVRKAQDALPLRTKPLKMRDGKNTLVDSAAVTAIMANFNVSTPARVEPWRKKVQQEAT